MIKKILPVITLMLLALSCSTVKEKERTTAADKLPGFKKGIEYLEIKTNMAASVAGNDQTVTANIKLAGYDSLAIDFYAPLGFKIGKFYSTTDSFYFYNAFENSAFEGHPTKENMEKAVKIPLSFVDFIHLVRGETVYPPEEYELNEETSAPSKLLFQYTGESDFIDYALYSTADNAILQYQRKDRSGNKLIDVVYRDFTEKAGYKLPQKIVIEFPEAGGVLDLELKNIEVNNDDGDPLSFDIPKSAQRFKLFEGIPE